MQTATPAPVEEMQVVLAKPALYRNSAGQIVRIVAGGGTLPKAIAERAISEGIGHPVESKEGAVILATYRGTTPPINYGVDGTWHDLGAVAE